MTTFQILARRAWYGGRKGRSAARRLLVDGLVVSGCFIGAKVIWLVREVCP